MYEYIVDEDKALRTAFDDLHRYLWLACEIGAQKEAAAIADEVRMSIAAAQKKLFALPGDPALRAAEPDDYDSIVKLSKGGNAPAKEICDLEKRMLGALTGRFAGCLLGVPVEGWSWQRMKTYAQQLGMSFPPVDYWTDVTDPERMQYETEKRSSYKKSCINGVAVDDDITYTLLGYEILAECGFDFTTADVGEAWKKYLPIACTAEEVALNNLRAGVPAEKAAEINNPYVQYIGADIRADGFAYAAAGDPHLAASLGYRDAFLSHRRNGIYGEMFFAAAEAAAFTVDEPMEALRIALNEIPENCLLHKDLEWAFETCPRIRNYQEAVDAVEERFREQWHAHTNNNACLTVFGIYLGGRDFTKAVGETIAMGFDNDCTGATVGSIVGACIGIDNIPSHWYQNFHNTVRTYMIGKPEYKIDEVASKLAAMVRARLADQNE